MNIEFIFSEFGSRAAEPPIQMVQEYFPGCGIKQMHRAEVPIEPVCSESHSRYGWRQHDYAQLVGLLYSKADIAIALDSDMRFVSENVRTIVPLTQKFGLCAPCNPRLLVATDTLIGTDSDKKLDVTQGTGYSYNTAIIAFLTQSMPARKYLAEAMRLMKADPQRLPLILWRAAWNTGFNPYLLPPQWCVCETQEGCGKEIILHVGHVKVKNHYGV